MSTFGDFVSSLASAFVSGGASNASSRKEFQRQQALQEQAARLNYEYSVKYGDYQYNKNIQGLKESPLATRQGYERANLNPMLMTSQGVGSANVAGSGSYTGTGQAPHYDMSQAISQGMSNAMDYARVQNETKQAEAQTDANYALADKTKMEKAKLVEELPYVGKKAKADYIKTQMESAKLENDIHYQNEYLKYLQNSLGLQRELGIMGFSNAKDVARIGAEATKYSANQGLYGSSINSAVNAALGLGGAILLKGRKSPNIRGFGR